MSWVNICKRLIIIFYFMSWVSTCKHLFRMFSLQCAIESRDVNLIDQTSRWIRCIQIFCIYFVSYKSDYRKFCIIFPTSIKQLLFGLWQNPLADHYQTTCKCLVLQTFRLRCITLNVKEVQDLTSINDITKIVIYISSIVRLS